jgi:hypothetical protein
MSTEDRKANTRRFFSEFSKGKAAAMAAMDWYYATDIVYHGTGGEEIRGLKNFKQFMGEMCDAFPDGHFTVDDMVIEGDRGAARYTVTGTHKGAYKGIPPTNKKVTMSIIGIVRRNSAGKIVEQWQTYDTMDVMKQMGLIPTPGKGK